MKIKSFKYFFVSLFFLTILLSNHVQASSESYIQTLTGKINKGDTCVVIDDKFLNMPIDQWNLVKHLSVENIVRFQIRMDTLRNFFNKNFSCTLYYSIKYFDSRDQDMPKEKKGLQLIVNYDTAIGAYYHLENVYSFNNAYKVILNVDSIKSPSFGDQVPPIFRVSNQILIERKYPFNSKLSNDKSTIISYDYTLNNLSESSTEDYVENSTRNYGPNVGLYKNHEPYLNNTGTISNAQLVLNTSNPQLLDVSWLPNGTGSEAYDIEWAFIDRDSEDGIAIANNTITVDQQFMEARMKNNSTRVTVSENNYSINLLYPSGFIIVRIRGVYYSSSNVRQTTSWKYSTDSNQPLLHSIIDGLDPNLNWQFTGSFAEDGKSKEVVSYFDGSLRNRQTVTYTKNVPSPNDNGMRVVVAETIFDQMGRPAVNILPSPASLPTLGQSLKMGFQPNFNINNAGVPLSYTDFTFNNCSPTNAINSYISSNKGAAQYYSPQNDFLLKQISNDPRLQNDLSSKYRYIPDAESHVYSQTVFTPDNTGRVLRQSGVGAAFRLGNNDTRYFYGKPLQRDLDKMFGVEVGSASHYLKNMVIDPNGQISVSYLNSSGKTIATALAGNAPPQLERLSSASNPNSITKLNQNLIQSNDFVRDASSLKMETTATFLAAVTGNFSLYYEVNPLSFLNAQRSDNSSFCTNCFYTIKISVKDICGNIIPVSIVNEQTFEGRNLQSCESADALIVKNKANFTVQVPGEYFITYQLSLLDSKIKESEDYYIQNNKNIKTVTNFFIAEMEKMVLDDCYTECSTCKEKLGTEINFTAQIKNIIDKEKYNYPAELNFNPNSSVFSNWLNTWIHNTYTRLYNQCIASQANCSVSISPCDAKLEMLKTDVLPGGQYALYEYDAVNDSYTVLEPNISILNRYNSTGVRNISFTNDLGEQKTTHTLTQSEFIKEYLKHPDWANEYVKLHIEYCNYLWCVDENNNSSNKNELSYKFDDNLQQIIVTADAAVAKNLFNKNNPTLIVSQDPFFSGGRGSGYSSMMQQDIANFSSVMKLTPGENLPVKNLPEFVDWILYCKPTNTGLTEQQLRDSWTNCTLDNACRSANREWELYKEYYIQLKAKYLEKVKNESVDFANCKNCFVGADAFTQNSACDYGNLEDYKIEILGNEPGSTNVNFVLKYYKNGIATPFSNNYSVTWGNFINDSQESNAGSLVPNSVETATTAINSTSLLLKQYTKQSGENLVFTIDPKVISIGCPPSNLNTCVVNQSNTVCPTYSDFHLERDLVQQYSDGYSYTEWRYAIFLVLNNDVELLSYDIELGIENQIILNEYWGDSEYVFESSVQFPAGQRRIQIAEALEYEYSGFGYQIRSDNFYLRPNFPIVCNSNTNSSISSFCATDPRYNDYKNKRRVFFEFSNPTPANNCAVSLHPTANQTPQEFTDEQNIKAKALAVTNALQELDALKNNWITRLKSVRDAENEADDEALLARRFGSIDDSKINTIVQDLATVSAYYINHPSVSFNDIRPVSVLPVGLSVNNFNSFKSVFEAHLSSDILQKGFNHLLIENPYSFDKKPYSTLPEIAELQANDVLSTTICNNFLAFKSQLQAQSATDFDEKLRLLFGYDYVLKPSQLTDLETKCTTTSNCNVKLLNEPLQLPVAFVTNNSSTDKNQYLDCNTIQLAFNTFNNLYPQVVINTRLYRVLVTNYINQLYGYALSYEDYADLKDKCLVNNSSVVFNKAAAPAIVMNDFVCAADLIKSVFSTAGQEYERYIFLEREHFRNTYVATCLSNNASAKIEGDQYEYHYTLYYYDQSGNLVKTVPPEGVELLTEQELENLDLFRKNEVENCNSASMPTVEDKNLTLQSISNALHGTNNPNGQALEMWLHSTDGTSMREFRFITPDKKIMSQVAIKDRKIWVELYKLIPTSNGEIQIVLSNQQFADISNLPRLLSWTHLIVQSSSDNLLNGTLELYVDGRKVNTQVATVNPGYPFDWSIEVNSSNTIVLPNEQLTSLKHLRLYNRQVSSTEVMANFTNSCLSPVGQLAQWNVSGNSNPLEIWGRFNLPNTCSNNSNSAEWVNVNNGGSLYVSDYSYTNNGDWNKIIDNLTNNFTVEFWVNPNGIINMDLDETNDLNNTAGTYWQHYAIFPGAHPTDNINHVGMGVSVGTNGINVFEHGAGYMPALLKWEGNVSGWTHVAVVYNNKQPSLYINGQFVKSGLISNKQFVSPSYTFGGGYYGYLNGYMDEVRIWNVARSQNHIYQYYNKPVESNVANLAHYWPISTTDGTVIKDIGCNPIHFVSNIFTPQINPSVHSPQSDTRISEYASRLVVPDHRLATTYEYNSLNQVVAQETPDAGKSKFWYDRLGRLTISQNAEQLEPTGDANLTINNRFSYTIYDAMGRIKEVGEKYNVPSVVTEEFVRNDVNGLNTWLEGYDNREVTVTAYDYAPNWVPLRSNGSSIIQQNLRKRVAATAIIATGRSISANNRPVAATYYNYDYAGNVKVLVQENKALRAAESQAITNADGLKELKYDYDLVSGKVNKVWYQQGKWDQFCYAYHYDAENRITEALSAHSPSQSQSTTINEGYTIDASYHYYLHGPLLRTELGKKQSTLGAVQALDYAYTLQGWLKGINGQILDPTREIGVLTYQNNQPIANNSVGKDVFAFSLGYYNGDYTPIGANMGANAFLHHYQAPSITHSTNFNANASNSQVLETGMQLFNGNISNATYAIDKIQNGATMGYSYRYDQLNRLKEMRSHQPLTTSNFNWDYSTKTEFFKESINYDANGNILTFNRNGSAGSLNMDALSYAYQRDVNGRLQSNKLRHVKDAYGNTNQGDIGNQPNDNYRYDNIGNLIADADEHISEIKWTVYGKIASIAKNNGSPNVSYQYDASGNRITKSLSNGNNTFYVRDAQGNTMAVYTFANGILTWAEQHLYGSSRLGMLTPFVQKNGTQSSDAYVAGDGAELIGKRKYELSNHLGNVMAVVTDKYVTDPQNAQVQIAEVLQANDYYTFGMQMPTRSFSFGSDYRYGFNGKENDNDLSEGGQDYGMRVYNSRIGKFLSVDPLYKEYPWYTPYQFAGNTPIQAIDLDGTEPYVEVGRTLINWFFDDLNKISTGVKNLGGGADKQITTPREVQKYNQIANDKESEIDISEYRNIRSTLGKFQAAAGLAQINDGVQSIGNKLELGVNGAAISQQLTKKVINKLAQKTVLKQTNSSGVKETLEVTQQTATKTPVNLDNVAAKGVGKALNGVDDVITNPSLLQGKLLTEVQSVLKNTTGWAEGTLTKGRSAGQGWTLRQLNSKGTDFTDLYIQYSPGSPRHFGGKPYWKVSSGNGGTQWFPAGQ